MIRSMGTTPIILTRYSQDIGFDSRIQARYIGNLEEGRSNVSVNSALSVGDRADHFRFKVTSDQFVRISTGELIGSQGRGVELAAEGTVRYQLLSASGQIRADSDPGTGAAYQAWQDLNSETNLKLAKGTYTLRVARGREAIASKEYVYSFTFRSNVEAIDNDQTDTASREFLTTERPAPAGATFDQYANVTAVLGLFTDVKAF